MRRNIPENLSEGISWVGIDWVKKCIESGKIFGTRKIFSPIAIERFFSVREANARADRRKSLRSKPDISASHDFQAVHVITSPKLSPTVSFSTITRDDPMQLLGPTMTPPTLTPNITPIVPVEFSDSNSACCVDPMIASPAVLSSVNHPGTDHAGLRRSKRLSVIGSSQGSSTKSFSTMYTIKKKNI